jgi:hypothetical protein
MNAIAKEINSVQKNRKKTGSGKKKVFSAGGEDIF